MIAFDFGVAAELYATRQHPRLLLGPEDVERLRHQVLDGDHARVMAALRRRIALLVAEAAAEPDTAAMLAGNGSHNSLAARLSYAITDIAFVALLDEDSAAIELVRRIMTFVVTDPKRPSRLGVAGLAPAFDLLHAQLAAAERQDYVAAAQAAIRNSPATFQQYYKAAGGNQTLAHSLSLLPLYLVVAGEPGGDELQENLTELLRRFEATLFVAINRDGYPEEDIGGYGSGVGAWLIWLAVYLRRAGVFDAFAACPHIARFGHASLLFVEPWGLDMANVGDHGDDFGHREMLAVLATVTDNPALLWLLGTLNYHHGKVHPENTLPDFWVEVELGPDLRVPASASALLVLDQLADARHPRELQYPLAFHDRSRGLVSMRSGWDADDTLVIFDGSQRSAAAQGHAHASCGHFLLSAFGEYFAIGPGRYGIEQSDQSVVLIDGVSGRSTKGEWCAAKHAGVLTACDLQPFVDSAAVDSSLQHNCQWARRSLHFVKGDGVPGYVWIVDDLNKADDWATYWWQLQSCPENTIEVHAAGATITGWRHGNQLDVHLAVPPPAEYPRPHTVEWLSDEAECSSRAYLTSDPSTVLERAFSGPRDHVGRYRRPADMVHGPSYVRPRLVAKVGGYNGRFMSLLLPRRAQSSPAVVRQLPALPASLAVAIEHGDMTDTIIFAYEHHLLEAGEIVGRGRWCVVRRRTATGEVVRRQIAEGDRLEVAGRPLPL